MDDFKIHSLGDVARYFGVQLWQVRRLFERGILPEPGRIGRYRIILGMQMPKVKDALIKAGYIKGSK